MKKRIKRNLSYLAILLTDGVMLSLAILLSHYERSALDILGYYDGHIGEYFFSGLPHVFLILLMYLFGLYTKRNDFWMETKQIFKAVFYLFLFGVLYAFLTKTSVEYSRLMFVLIAVNMLWMLPLGRVLSKRILGKAGLWPLNVWVIGQSEQARRLKNNLALNWYLGYRPVEKKRPAGLVFIATEGIPVSELEQMVHFHKMNKKEVVLVPYLHSISFANADIIDLSLGRMSLINIQNQLFKPRNLLLKKVAEIMLVIAMLPIVVVVFAVIALLIKLDSPGSILFRQKRMGKDNKPFLCYKFRSMYENGDELLAAYLAENLGEKDYYEKFHKYHNDPRITRVGKIVRKLSLDELPQIINVLKGEMNLIGPRPYMPDEKEKMGSSADTILHVAPGLTGLWQVSGRNQLDFKERVELDNWYIQNWSLWLDFIIFIKTFEVLFTRKGAQ